MPEYDNEKTGVLFKNDKKETESHPDYKGQAQVNGQEFWLSAWIKTSGKGQKFMRLSFQPKNGGGGGQTQVVTPQPSPAGDEIPF